jgi:hypothetical protein
MIWKGSMSILWSVKMVSADDFILINVMWYNWHRILLQSGLQFLCFWTLCSAFFFKTQCFTEGVLSQLDPIDRASPYLCTISWLLLKSEHSQNRSHHWRHKYRIWYCTVLAVLVGDNRLRHLIIHRLLLPTTQVVITIALLRTQELSNWLPLDVFPLWRPADHSLITL